MNARPPTWPVEPPLPETTLAAWRRLARSHDRALTQAVPTRKEDLADALGWMYEAAFVLDELDMLGVVAEGAPAHGQPATGRHLIALTDEPRKSPPMRP